jgi:hypothetical protein
MNPSINESPRAEQAHTRLRQAVSRTLTFDAARGTPKVQVHQ